MCGVGGRLSTIQSVVPNVCSCNGYMVPCRIETFSRQCNYLGYYAKTITAFNKYKKCIFVKLLVIQCFPQIHCSFNVFTGIYATNSFCNDLE